MIKHTETDSNTSSSDKIVENEFNFFPEEKHNDVVTSENNE